MTDFINRLSPQTITAYSNKDKDQPKIPSSPTSWTNFYGDIFVPVDRLPAHILKYQPLGLPYVETIMRANRFNRLPPELASHSDFTSSVGFLGKKEGLLRLIAEDAAVVESMGTTHQDIAEALRHAFKQFRLGRATFEYLGQRYSIDPSSGGHPDFQDSPFFDGATGNTEIQLKSGAGQYLYVSGLMPHFIARYGFYNGFGAAYYRVHPEVVIDFFGLAKPQRERIEISDSLSPRQIQKATHMNGYPIGAIQRFLSYEGEFLVEGESIVGTIASDLKLMMRHAIDPKNLAVRLKNFLEKLNLQEIKNGEKITEVLNGRYFEIEKQISTIQLGYPAIGVDAYSAALFKLKPTGSHRAGEITLSFDHLILIENYHFFGGHKAPMRLDPLELDCLLPGGRTHHRQVYEGLPANRYSRARIIQSQNGFSRRAIVRR